MGFGFNIRIVLFCNFLIYRNWNFFGMIEFFFIKVGISDKGLRVGILKKDCDLGLGLGIWGDRESLSKLMTF